MDDWQLLRDYANRNSDEAFRILVDRYAALVYHAALRQAGNPHTAQEVTQAVFIALAQKADRIPRGVILSGWLFRATRFAFSNLAREQTRRRRREEEAVTMETIHGSDELASVWEQIEPHLNDALDKLPRKDREAVLVRFFQDKSHREVARVLGVSEDAAKARVSRAVEKLRLIFARRGFAVPTAVLLATISSCGAQAAPAGLTASVVSVAGAKGTLGTASTLTIAKGVLKIMAWTKMKTMVAVGACLILAGGISTTVMLVGPRYAPGKYGYEREYLENPAKFPRENVRMAKWRLNTWPEERRREEARIKSRQLTNETVQATTIDLRPHLNAALSDSPGAPAGSTDDHLAALPSGVQVYAGVPFDVAGLIQLNGTVMAYFKKGSVYPVQVGNIRINRRCARLHLLHGANAVLPRDFGTVVAKLVLHYQDGTTAEINLVGGEHVFDWWSPLFTTGVNPRYSRTVAGTERAWTGSNPMIEKSQPDESLILYRSTFANPRPDAAIAGLDYVSTMTEVSPFMVGLTVD